MLLASCQKRKHHILKLASQIGIFNNNALTIPEKIGKNPQFLTQSEINSTICLKRRQMSKSQTPGRYTYIKNIFKG